MVKKKTALLLAMIAIVLITAIITNTNAKYIGVTSMKVNMDIETYYSSLIHSYARDYTKPYYYYNGYESVGLTYEYTVKGNNGKTATITFPCRVAWETSNVEINLGVAGTGKNVLKITTIADEDGKCYDPFLILDFVTDFKKVNEEYNGIPSTFSEGSVNQESSGFDTNTFRYVLIPYYCPVSELPEKADYNAKEYQYKDFNHLRVYTSTTENTTKYATTDSAMGPEFGANRYVVLPESFDENSTKGIWVYEIIDLAATNQQGSRNDKNGNPNWDGYLYRLRLDIGQVGGLEAWGDDHDCPVGKNLYIGEMLFFSSLYGAQRAAINLSVSTYNDSFDPQTATFSNEPITLSGGLTEAQIQQIADKKAELEAS